VITIKEICAIETYRDTTTGEDKKAWLVIGKIIHMMDGSEFVTLHMLPNQKFQVRDKKKWDEPSTYPHKSQNGMGKKGRQEANSQSFDYQREE